MATLKEEAQRYEPKKTLNIAELDKIPVNIELHDGKGKTSEGEEFKYKYVIIEGTEYRVAGSIIGGLKALLQKMPTLQFFSVVRIGQGMNTRYNVVPFVGQQPPQEQMVY